METIPFTKKAIKAYLDDCIELWRKYRDNLLIKNIQIAIEDDEYKKKIAPYYIDAFQSVRISLFGELKK